ncbi:MAG: CdaR family protein [Deltaproteobacteria bacterium]|nr:CdaR family protein [Deltaproteobacteria bacterium]
MTIPKHQHTPPQPEPINLAEIQEAVHRFFTENLLLKLFSLGMAVVVWSFVASQHRGEVSELKFTTPLVLKNIPTNMVVTQSGVESVSVLVSIGKSMVNSLNPNLFQVSIDLSNQLAGGFDYNLSEKNVIYNNAPAPRDITILQISPTSIPLTLEETINIDIPIKPRFSGDMAPGFTLDSIRIKPAVAKAQGPRSVLEKLRYIYTRPLDVQDLQNNVEMAVELDMPLSVRLEKDQKQAFQAMITVSNNPLRLLLRDIRIVFENAHHVYKTSTSKVNVFLEGPKEVVETLNVENTYAIIDMEKYPPGDYRGLSTTVVVPDNVRVLEQWPIVDLFVINRPLK